jgi:hypothetical protein
MANYTSTARTNYFRVKDVDAFNKWIEQFGGIEVVKKTIGLETGFGMLFDDGMPTVRWEIDLDADGNEQEGDVDIDFMDELAEHLADDEVAIFQEAGAENMRYVNGHTIAINNKKEVRSINLDDIYEVAKQLGKNITKAQY